MRKKIGRVIGICVAIVGVGLLKLLSDSKNTKYSSDWFESLSDEELDIEREKVRLEHCSGAENAWNVLGNFDDEKRRRSNKCHKNEEFKYPKRREHGWYLPNDD